MLILRVFNRLRTVSGQNIFNIRVNDGKPDGVCPEVYREMESNTNGFHGTFCVQGYLTLRRDGNVKNTGAVLLL